MKVLLKDLKPSDKFYKLYGQGVGHFEVTGDSIDKESSFMVKLIGYDMIFNENIYQYVYTEETEAIEELLKLLDKRIKDLKDQENSIKQTLCFIEQEKEKYQYIYDERTKQDNNDTAI